MTENSTIPIKRSTSSTTIDTPSNDTTPSPSTNKRQNAKKRKPDPLATAKYYFENGFRKVEPYDWIYESHAKARWQKKTILQVFVTEFVDQTPEYYRNAILNGRITVNNKLVGLDYVIRNGDLIQHRIHRHEAPTSDKPIRILHQDEDFLVVDKPPSVPVHKSGRYQHNSVVHILQKEHGFGALHTLHRIDRLTSGVLLLGFTDKARRQLEKAQTSNTLRKTYLARVLGEFPNTGIIIVNEPILPASHKLGLNVVHPDGKPCETHFERVSFNGRTSVVRCHPISGRGHQIRVHLQYLGFPIANDPLYAHKVWGEKYGKGGVQKKDAEEVVVEFTKIHYDREGKHVSEDSIRDNVVLNVKEWSGDKEKDGKGVGVAAQEKVEKEGKQDQTEENAVKRSPWYRHDCLDCNQPKKDPLPWQTLIWLKAMKYESEDFSFEASLPEWAREDYQGDEEILKEFESKWSGYLDAEDDG